MCSLPFRLPLLFLVLIPVVSAQGVYFKAIEQAHRFADKTSYGGEVNFPDGVARFFELGLGEITAGTPPAFKPSAGLTKLTETLRASGKPQPADALAEKLNKLLADANPQVAQAIRGGVATMKLEESGVYKASHTALVDSLRKIVEPVILDQLRSSVQQLAQTAGLPDAFDAFVTASAAKLADPKAALSALEDQIVLQVMDNLFTQLAKQERIYRADPLRSTDKLVVATFNTLKQ